MNMQQQIAETFALARRIEDDWRLPAEDRKRAEAIRKLLEKPAEAEKLGTAARAFALENCGIERMLSRMEAVFQRAAS